MIGYKSSVRVVSGLFLHRIQMGLPASSCASSCRRSSLIQGGAVCRVFKKEPDLIIGWGFGVSDDII
jgi:hypothetical protein